MIRQRIRRSMTGGFPISFVRILKYLHALFIFLCCGCGATLTSFSDTLHISSLAQKMQHHEIIKILQPRIERRESISSFQLFILAGAYFEIRNYEKALSTVDLLQRQIAQGDSSYLGADLSVYPRILRGLIALDLGDPHTAEIEASEAYALLNRTNGGANPFYKAQSIQICGILGVAHALQKHHQEADRWVAALLSIDTRDTILGPEKYIAIARIYMAKKQFEKALAAIQHPEAEIRGVITVFYDQTFQNLPKLFILIKCLYETGKLQEAKSGYDQLLKHPQIREIGGLFWLVLLDRARIARTEGQQAVAEDLLRQAAEVIERQRSSISTEAGRIGYVGDKQVVYQELVALLVASGRAADAFECVERAKGRALVDLLASQKHLAPKSPQAERMAERLDQLSKAELGLDIVSDPASGETSRRRGVAAMLRADIANEAPELASLVMVNNIPVREIQDRLSSDETILEYYASGDAWYAFVVTRRDIRAKVLRETNLEWKVEAARKALVNPRSQDYPATLDALSEHVFMPVADMIGTAKLIIVPHGVLHYLPFGALSSGKKYLVDQYGIRVLPSASVMKFMKARKVVERALILGNPSIGDPSANLRYAQDEALSIAGLLPQPMVLLREKATASMVKSSGSRFDVIHFAAHGFFDAERPLNSALLLANDESSEGTLRVGDLYNLTLDADLVTLSACETALSKVSNGDDVVGFTRGLLYAGSRSIVSSLWKVDDRATRDLMVDFYQGAVGAAKDEALRRAQLEVRKQYPHPYFWAAFVLTGNAQ